MPSKTPALRAMILIMVAIINLGIGHAKVGSSTPND
jgi:hypothetical protein